MVVKKKNSEFKPVKLHLKIDLVSYPAHVKKSSKYIYVTNFALIYRYTFQIY